MGHTFVFSKLTLGCLLLFHSVVGKRFYLTPHGECSDCGFKNGDYQWCTLGTGFLDWHYCSTTPGHTSKNWTCKAGHECGRHGYSYMWCYTDNDSWDYCSLIEDSSVMQLTYTSEECQSYCNLGRCYNKHYVCRMKNGDKDYCSMVEGVAANGKGCGRIEGEKESFCDHHGSDSKDKWCRGNNSSDWGYCSTPLMEENILQSVFTSNLTKVRSCDGFELVQSTTRQLANGRRLVTTFFRENVNPQLIREATGNLRENAQLVLYNWHSNRRSNGKRDGRVILHTYGVINLDRQGSSDCTNCTAFQLRTNGSEILPSAVVAQIIIDRDLSGYSTKDYNRVVVTGLHHSLNTASKVWINQQLLEQYANPRCPSKNPLLP